VDAVDLAWPSLAGRRGDGEVGVGIDVPQVLDDGILADAGGAGDDDQPRPAPGSQIGDEDIAALADRVERVGHGRTSAWQLVASVMTPLFDLGPRLGAAD
jgi:hypothetical protein